MADVQLDFSLDRVATQSNITKELETIVKNINNSGVLKFSASIDEASVSKIKKQISTISQEKTNGQTVFSTDKLDLYATKVDDAKERIESLKRSISNLKTSNLDISNVTNQLSILEDNLAKAQNSNLTEKDRVVALNNVKTAQTQLNAEIQKATTQYHNLASAERQSVNEDRIKTSQLNKSIAKYNQLKKYLEKYESALKKAGKWDEGQTLLARFNNGDLSTDNVAKQEQAFTSYKKSCIDAGVETDTLGTKLKNLFTQHLDTAIAMAGIHALQQAMQQVYQNVVELDSAITDLQIASGYSRSQTKGLVSEYSDLAQQLGSTTTQVAQAADGWIRQGYSVADTNELVTDSMMLSKLGQIDSAESTTALTSALKGYKLEVSDAANVVDKLTAVDMAAAASAGGIAKSMAECATSANLAGINMNDLIGYLAEIKQVTQDGDESVGNFAKTLFARMGNVKSGRLVDPETSESLSDVETVLNSYNIKLRDTNSNFRNFGDVLTEVASHWDDYDNVAQHAIATAFAGTRQQEKFIVLLDNYDEAMRLSSVAAESAGSAQEKYANAYLPSVEAAQNNATAAFEKFSQAVLDSGLVSGVFNAGAGILGFLTNVVSICDGLPVKIIAVVSAIALLDKLNVGKFMPSIPKVINGRVSKSVNCWEIHKSYYTYNIA